MIAVLVLETEGIGQRLKRLREAKGLSKYRLAKLSGISETYIYHLEGGHIAHPRIDTLIALAAGLGVSLAELAGEKPTGPAKSLRGYENIKTTMKYADALGPEVAIADHRAASPVDCLFKAQRATPVQHILAPRRR